MPALRTRATHPPAVRSLEVSTAPSTPSLKIIAPTPRAFAFPASHNLSDSPYSSPPNSPFERDLRGSLDASASPASTPSPSVSSSHHDECRSPPPLSAFTHTIFPAPAAASPSPAPARPQSPSSTILGSPFEERRPKKGDDDYVKRPENAFILFRRQCCEDLALSLSTSSSAPSPTPSGSTSAPPAPKKPRQADLSRTISQRWKALSPEERSHWDDLAKEKKRQHEMLHPNYVYRPRRSGAKNRSSASTAAPVSPTAAVRRKHSAPTPPQIEFVLPTERTQHGRSASSPPYQTFQVPNVYASSPSPSSAPSESSLDASADDPTSLMALILQGNPDGVFSFDYVPNFESTMSLEPSAFLQAVLSLGDAGSPASSTGSGPSSPYTPAGNSFHPSVFTSPHAHVHPHSSATAPDADAHADMMLGLYDPAASPALDGEPDYTSYAPAWLAASPWAPGCAGTQSDRLAPGDFELGGFPGMEVQWGLPHAHASDLSLSGPYNARGEMLMNTAIGGEHDQNAPGAHFADFDGASDGGDMNFEDIFSMNA
ncbi:hypothetical protein B0H19DRAFT_92332 [Mycena capillaripes]|nr:hypothetical protein B0H19DRAFT_92332 [Mycena capillaripes]